MMSFVILLFIFSFVFFFFSIPEWYHCLKVLLSLNHLILEPNLDQLLSSSWVNSECMEAHVQNAREVSTYSYFLFLYIIKTI